MGRARKYTVENIKSKAFKDYGLILISSEYIAINNPMLWEDSITGTRFTRSWDSILHGHTKPITLNDYQKDKNFIENYGSLGYKYNKTETEYLNADKIGNHRIFCICHPELNGEWRVTMHHFKRDAYRKLNLSGKSTGEVIISSMLSYNKVTYLSQVPMKINNKEHLFDFFLPEYKIYIEYDGIQHFKPIDYFGGEVAFEDRKLKDDYKNKAVESLGYKLIRISYKENSPDKIMKILDNNLPISIRYSPDMYKGYINKIALYYSSHTVRETALEYGISTPTVSSYYKIVYGIGKVDYLRSLHTIIAEYYDNHSLKDTCTKFCIDRHTVTSSYKSKYGISKRDRKRVL